MKRLTNHLSGIKLVVISLAAAAFAAGGSQAQAGHGGGHGGGNGGNHGNHSRNNSGQNVMKQSSNNFQALAKNNAGNGFKGANRINTGNGANAGQVRQVAGKNLGRVAFQPNNNSMKHASNNHQHSNHKSSNHKSDHHQHNDHKQHDRVCQKPSHCHPWEHCQGFCWSWPGISVGYPVPVCGTVIEDVTEVTEVVESVEVAEPVAAGVDLEFLGIALVDAGDAETKEGPTYRVWVRNNSNVAIEQGFDVGLVATNGQDPSEKSPSAIERIESIDAGEEIDVDIRLPFAVNLMGKNAAGERQAFTTLFAAVDARREITETNEENNAVRLARTEVESVDEE